MARYEITSWLIGDNVPLRLEIRLNGTPTNSEITPTVSAWDIDGVKQVDAQNMTVESTGVYIYYADTSSYPVGNVYWVATYQLSTKTRMHKDMFFAYDQDTWAIIDRVRQELDNIQEGELSSSAIWSFWNASSRAIDRDASSSADADLKIDATYAMTKVKSYISYLTEHERVGHRVGTAQLILMSELRNELTDAMTRIIQSTTGPGDVLRGVFGTTESSMAFSNSSGRDKGLYGANERVP